MKLKVLAVDIYLSGEEIDYERFNTAPSFSDYDVVIIDPNRISDIWTKKISPDRGGFYRSYAASDGGFSKALEVFMQDRADETKLLLEVIEGIVIIFLRNRGPVLKYRKSEHKQDKYKEIDNYQWLPSKKYEYKDVDAIYFPGYIFNPKSRPSKEVVWYDTAHPFFQYFMAFEGEISSEAVVDDTRLLRISKPIAKNKAKEVIAFELSFKRGKIIFLPPLSDGADTKKVTGILIDCIRKSLGWTEPVQRPKWVENYQLPGESQIKKKLSAIEEEIQAIKDKKQIEEESLNRLEKLRGLLYEKGKYGLEPCVREAFRTLGFNVFEPDQYEEEYDLYTKEDSLTVIGEIEGSTGPVDVEKFRQLQDYVTDEDLKGAECKGILVGNGFCEKEPDKRDEQFTPHAIRGCKRQRYCRMTTFELFKAVLAVLSDPKNEQLKDEIKQQMIGCEDEFKFDSISRGEREGRS